MRLCQPPDGSTSPKYKLLHFLTIMIFYQEPNELAFNWDTCCHLVICLQLIASHYTSLFIVYDLPQYTTCPGAISHTIMPFKVLQIFRGVGQAGSLFVFFLGHLTLSLPWLMELWQFQGSPTEAG